MNPIPLIAANKNHMKIQRYNPTVFDYRRITLATNKGTSHILESYKAFDFGSNTEGWYPKLRVDKLASSEALILFNRVRYAGYGTFFEPALYLSQKNHSDVDIIFSYGNSENRFFSDEMSYARSVQDLPIHSLEGVIIHVPYGVRFGAYTSDELDDLGRLNGLSDNEIITRPAGIGLPPTLTFGKLDGVTPQATVSLDSAESRQIVYNHPLRGAFLNLPAMISGIPYDATQHGGEIYKNQLFLPQRYAVVFRFSEDVR